MCTEPAEVVRIRTPFTAGFVFFYFRGNPIIIVGAPLVMVEAGRAPQETLRLVLRPSVRSQRQRDSYAWVQSLLHLASLNYWSQIAAIRNGRRSTACRSLKASSRRATA